ncbi:hypothetical protein M1310_00950 [Candidatus Marsarchaeota archaeon]|nr:hypothetical protein [Candidatus Marsarchaeota archaeon]
MQANIQRTVTNNSYVAENVANIVGRIRGAFGNVTLVAYGGIVNSMCCGMPQKPDTVSFALFDNHGLMSSEKEGQEGKVHHPDIRTYHDKKRMESKGLFADGPQESRFMRFYDSITGMYVEVGITHAAFLRVEENMRAITNREEISFKNTFLGIYVKDMIKRSVQLENSTGSVLVPCEPHQLYLLHALLSAEHYSYEDSVKALISYYRHHYGSIGALKSERYASFGIGGRKVSETIQNDISNILRTHD